MKLELRDYFAGQALLGLMKYSADRSIKCTETAYQVADAMLKARDAGKKPAKVTKVKAVFVPPDVMEIGAYCRSRGNNINAQKFYDFYASKGWMIGKNKMKDWKAAVRTWENQNKPSQFARNRNVNDVMEEQ